MTDWFVHIDNYALAHADLTAEAVHARGLQMAVIGPAEQIALLEHVDLKIPADFGDPSSVSTALRSIEREGEIAAIRSIFGLPESRHSLAAICAQERERYGLAGPSAAALDMANVKSLTRACLGRQGVDQVHARCVYSAKDTRSFFGEVGGPIILKPLTGVGAGFVRRCDTADDASDAFATIIEGMKNASHRPTRNPDFIAISDAGEIAIEPTVSLLAEEWIDGREISVECIALDNDILPLVVNDKLVLDEAEWTVREPLLISPPTRLSTKEIASARAYACSVIRALGLRNCVCHVEMRIAADGTPILLEINPRIGAGCVRDSLNIFWNVDPVGLDIDLALGIRPQMSRFERSNQHHVMIFLFTEKQGVLKEISGVERLMRQPGVLRVRQMTDLNEAVDGRFEEQFILGIWRRLIDRQSARQAYDKTVSEIEIHVD